MDEKRLREIEEQARAVTGDGASAVWGGVRELIAEIQRLRGQVQRERRGRRGMVCGECHKAPIVCTCAERT